MLSISSVKLLLLFRNCAKKIVFIKFFPKKDFYGQKRIKEAALLGGATVVVVYFCFVKIAFSFIKQPSFDYFDR